MTNWVVRNEVQRDCHEVVHFHRYKGAFEDFLAANSLKDSEEVNGDRLPPPLSSLGIGNVYRNGRFVYFVLPHTSLLADDATSEFIWQLDNNGGAIETILSTTKRGTYHIQHLNSAPGWYFWMHN